jgi:hypothetical protein
MRPSFTDMAPSMTSNASFIVRMVPPRTRRVLKVLRVPL